MLGAHSPRASCTTAVTHETRSYPLTMNIDYRVLPDGSANQATEVDQRFTQNVTVGNLTNGTAYTFKVAATNGVGTGTPSTASDPVTPAAPTVPGAPAQPAE